MNAPVPLGKGPWISQWVMDAATKMNRIRRRYPDDYAIEELAHHIEWLDISTYPKASELFNEFHEIEEEDEAVTHALDVVDARSATVQRLLKIRDPYLDA